MVADSASRASVQHTVAAGSVLLAFWFRTFSRSMRVPIEPLVQWDREGEQLLFAVEGVDHLDVELRIFERWSRRGRGRRRRGIRLVCCGR